MSAALGRPPSVATDLVDPITGRRIRRLTAPPCHNLHTYYNVSPWSPNGKRIVYASGAPGGAGAELWVMDAEGGQSRLVATHPTFHLHTACWQQWVDDRTVVVPLKHDGQHGMRLIDVDSCEERFVPLPGLLTWLAPDGRSGTILVDGPEGPEVGIIALHTLDYTRVCTLAQVREMTPYRDLIEGRRSQTQNARWSPDGRYVLIAHGTSTPAPAPGRVGNEVPALSELFVYAVETRRFSYVARMTHHPNWHPNSADVLFVWHNPATGRQELRLVGRDGTKERVIFDAEHVPSGHPSFHPTRHDLLVTDSYGGRFGFGIVLVDLRRERQELVASMPLGEDPMATPAAHGADPPNVGSWSYPRWTTNAHPCWSPDGSAILYADLSSGSAQLHLVDVSDLTK